MLKPLKFYDRACVSRLEQQTNPVISLLCCLFGIIPLCGNVTITDYVPPNATVAPNSLPDVDWLSYSSATGRRLFDIGFGDAHRMPDEGCIQGHNGDRKTRGQAWLLS